MSENDDDRDRRLAALLAELMDASRQGATPDLEAMARDPELADELRELWAAARVADDLVADAGSHDDCGGFA